MFSSSSTSLSKKRLLLIVGILTGAVVLLEILFSSLLPEGLMTQSLRGKCDYIVSHPAPDIQVMGDSVSQGGIFANRLEETLNAHPGSRPVTVRNDSLGGTSPLFAYYVLKRQLRAGHKPDVILFAPNMAVTSNPIPERFWGRFARPGEMAESLRLGMPLSDMVFGLACRLSYTMRYREELRGAVTAGNLEFFKTARLPVELPGSESVESQPAPPENPNETFDARELPWMLKQPFRPLPYVDNHIRAFIELAAENGIHIFWIPMPIPQVVSDFQRESGTVAGFERYLQSFATEYENVRILFPESAVYPDSHFKDTWHLTDFGAWNFSGTLGEALTMYLSENPELLPGTAR